MTGKTIWYVESHLDQDLGLDAVAQAVGVSRFHLTRAFGAATGTSLAAYIRARRLSVAAKALSNGAPDILSVALSAGYNSHEAFTRAFRQCFGATPEQYRERPAGFSVKLQEPLPMQSSASLTQLGPPRIESRGGMLLFGLSKPCPAAGDPDIPGLWARFGPCIGNVDAQVGRVAYGVIYGSDQAGRYDYLCGVEVRAFPPQPAEFTRLRIPAQSYAVFAHREHVASIAQTWGAIWERGLSDAGYTAAEGPAFERYGEEFDGATGLGGFEIWVPIMEPRVTGRRS